MTTLKTSATENTADREIIISRVFDAPRELVWEAWTNPRHVANWWGPQGFSTTIEEMDVRPGGTWKHVMRGPDGTEYPNKSIFTEVVKPERIVYSHAGGKKGGPGVHIVFIWTFDAVGDKTRLTIHQLYSTAADRDRVVKEFRAIEGGNQTLGRLADYLPSIGGKPRHKLVITLPSDTEILLTRSFNAPRHLVWEAMTKPEHVARWYGPRYLTCSVCEIDFRPGGSWRYVLNGPDGKGGVFKGVYHEITPPEKIVATECFDEPRLGSPQWKSTVTLAETDGVTTVTTRVVHPTKAARDGHYYSGMEAGAADTFDRLTELLDAMAKTK